MDSYICFHHGMTRGERTRDSQGGRRRSTTTARALAVALFDLAWLLPRTVGAEERQADPLPRSELEVMRLLGRRPGTNVNTVASELGLQPSNVSTSIRSLVARGLVERRSDETDRRQVQLYLTARAQASRERREQQWGGELAGLLAELTTDERSRLTAALPVLTALAARLSATAAEGTA
jgi:DNA-binding MarR family transcriptional regulator